VTRALWIIERKAKTPTFPGDRKWRPWPAKGVFESMAEASAAMGPINRGDFGAVYNTRARKYVPAKTGRKP
jgi:hypothetical protein